MTTTPSDRIRLLIVDDHPIVRDGLVSILHEGEPDLEVVGEAGDGKEAVEAWRTLRPSVTIMDLQLPGQSGVEAIKAIRREDPEAFDLPRPDRPEPCAPSMPGAATSPRPRPPGWWRPWSPNA